MQHWNLPPWVVPAAGLLLIAAAFAVWAKTGRETSTFVGAGVLMVGAGVGLSAGNHKRDS